MQLIKKPVKQEVNCTVILPPLVFPVKWVSTLFKGRMKVYFLIFAGKTSWRHFERVQHETVIFEKEFFIENASRGRIFSCVRPFCERALSALDP